MFPVVSKRDRKCRRRALVLGERAAGNWIAQQLEKEGFEPVFQSALSQKTFPHFADPDALEKMRSLFAEFANQLKNDKKVYKVYEEFPIDFWGVVHPGTTIWAERPELPSLAREFNLTVIGPPERVLVQMGQKLTFLLSAEKQGIIHGVLNPDPMHSVREIEEFIHRSRQPFPFKLRTVKGGGYFGTFVVDQANALQKGLPLWIDQLRRNVGEVILFAERCFEGARQITVPFARFQKGRIQIFPFVDSSLQSQHRKWVEICPARALDIQTRNQLVQWTQSLANQSGYVGVGAFEFAVDPSQIFLLEALPRLNTGYHLWEQIAGTNAISWQLATLDGNEDPIRLNLKSSQIETSGLLLRIYSENSYLQLPQPGFVFEGTDEKKWIQNAANAEVSFAFQQKEHLNPSDSGLIGLLFSKAHHPKQAIENASFALDQLWLAGTLQTNEQFLRELLSHPWIKEGMLHAAFIDEDFIPLHSPPGEVIEVAARLCASISSQVQTEVSEEVSRWVVSEKWVLPVCLKDNAKKLAKITVGLHYWNYEGRNGVSGKIRLSNPERTFRACAFPTQDRWFVRLGAWFFIVRKSDLSAQAAPHQIRRVRFSALVMGRVHALLFQKGSVVPAQESLLIVESQGRFVSHSLPKKARIMNWKVMAEDRVSVGEELADIDLVV